MSKGISRLTSHVLGGPGTAGREKVSQRISRLTSHVLGGPGTAGRETVSHGISRLTHTFTHTCMGNDLAYVGCSLKGSMRNLRIDFLRKVLDLLTCLGLKSVRSRQGRVG